MVCKYCGSERLKKDGVRNGVQKWRCKECNRSHGEIDRRSRYDEKIKKMALTIYLEGNGFRQTARILSEMFGKKIWHQRVFEWIKQAGLKAEEEQKAQEKQEVKEDKKVEILEMDELFTFVKKN